ncbi:MULTISPECIES: GNAT family N-acetyltransferase [Brucella/Ochrobactrum group]|uniref:N-acetyltransferase n=1 Tax=Brucella pseudintermedia TaxID=370111 RepID=A0ABY5UET6_9HYPH|nr:MULTISPECIES: N-acetyltransferase [Brucella/Ochrobactrum group]KAB2685397.1 N-acetyltransferase [Brucella pseudintermedia]MCO7728897.1 N-acetyltransferase [Brucella intermedia]NKE76736.1 N-acetyltransferase [Ochrobactrum sp. MC-1LL]TWH00751.1 putative acetyltransferase [Ochrobactrum sp. J50]UWL61207.1 N-acetyltransferase [Brucella pseudintermedia]
MHIRKEMPQDAAEIRRLTDEAFRTVAYSNQKEGEIVDALRAAKALTLSLVAEEDGQVLGHVAFSPVQIGGEDKGWYGLGPVSVSPDRQGEGIGGKLIREGLALLRAAGAKGCVLLGDPGYYGRFGFKADQRLKLPGVPPEYFQCLPFGPDIPEGDVAFDKAFDV